MATETFNPDLLVGRTALITGGGTGLGLAIATRYAELGASLILCGRREAPLDRAAAMLRNVRGGDVRAIVCDIRDPAAVTALMQQSWAGGAPDILVNNAAATFIAQSHMLSARAADAILAPTLHGALYCTIEAGRRWIEAGSSGVVLSILSTSTITGRAFTTPSAMAKAALLAMTRSLAVEWGPRKIRLVAIAPGSFPTPGAEERLMPGVRRDASKLQVPLGRLGRHSELADLASFLVSESAGYMTGEMVVLDGGMHLRNSGVEDLLLWTDQQWAALRAERA